MGRGSVSRVENVLFLRQYRCVLGGMGEVDGTCLNRVFAFLEGQDRLHFALFGVWGVGFAVQGVGCRV